MAKDQQEELNSLLDDDEDPHEASKLRPHFEGSDEEEEEEEFLREGSVDAAEYAELVHRLLFHPNYSFHH